MPILNLLEYIFGALSLLPLLLLQVKSIVLEKPENWKDVSFGGWPPWHLLNGIGRAAVLTISFSIAFVVAFFNCVAS